MRHGEQPPQRAMESHHRDLVLSRATAIVAGDARATTTSPPSSAAPRFAHPAERALARLLTFYRVEWRYEPTTFVLERDAHGAPITCFAPDFFLPEHDRYLELTTMRQAHVTRKNRKLRLLQRLYPEATVQLLYRRDVEEVLRRVEAPARVPGPTLGRILVSAGQIAERVRAEATALLDDGPPDVLLALGEEAGPFTRATAKALFDAGARLDVADLTLTRYRADRPDEPVRVRRRPQVELEGRRVLLVAARLSTGLSLDFACRWLIERDVAEVRATALVDRPQVRLLDVPLVGSGFQLDAGPVAGYGLTVDGRFGTLADIVAIMPRS
jgi:hypoxanthine-guanine phosphoribosyltransferase